MIRLTTLPLSAPPPVLLVALAASSAASLSPNRATGAQSSVAQTVYGIEPVRLFPPASSVRCLAEGVQRALMWLVTHDKDHRGF